MRMAAVVMLAPVLLFGCNKATPDWRPFESKTGRFSILFPGPPEELDQSVPTVTGPIKAKYFMVDLGEISYSINFVDYAKELIEVSDTKALLDGGRDGVITNVQGRLMDEKDITLEGYPGRELWIALEHMNAVIHVRYYLVDCRLYLLQVVYKKDQASSPDIVKYLDSFKLKR